MVFKEGEWTDSNVRTKQIEENYAICAMNEVQIATVIEIESVIKILLNKLIIFFILLVFATEKKLSFLFFIHTANCCSPYLLLKFYKSIN